MIKEFVLGRWRRLRHIDWMQQYNEIKTLTTREKARSFQKRSLEQLLVHAYQNVPYYNDVLRQAGVISQSGQADLSRFAEVPLLTKDIIRECGENIISRGCSQSKSSPHLPVIRRRYCNAGADPRDSEFVLVASECIANGALAILKMTSYGPKYCGACIPAFRTTCFLVARCNI